MPRIDKKINKEKQEKDLFKLYRELSKVRDAIWHSEMIELPKPRFVGFRRFFVLREDIARRKDAKDIREILAKINCEKYSKTKDFSHYDMLDKYWRAEQRIKELSTKEWESLSGHQKTFFCKVWDGKKNCNQYFFQQPWMFVYKVKRHYVSKVPMLSPQMESRLSELHNKIFRQDYIWPRICRLLGYKVNWYNDDYLQRKERFIEHFMNEAIEVVNYPEEFEE